jgi:hypothetical protein
VRSTGRDRVQHEQILRIVLLLIACSTLATTQRESRPLLQVLRAWQIAFVRDGSIWVCNGDGSGQKPLMRNGHSPAWSPDKSQIAFARDGDMWVAAADGSRQQAITSRWAGGALKDDVPSDAATSLPLTGFGPPEPYPDQVSHSAIDERGRQCEPATDLLRTRHLAHLESDHQRVMI